MLKQAKFINKSDKEEEKMAEEYNVQAVMNELREKEEMDPDRHDGCYELMRETVKSYSKLQDFSVLDYNDLNLVYLTTVGTWKQGVEGKKKNVEESHLLIDDKKHLKALWDEVWEKARQKQYSNSELGNSGNCSIGLFGTGFFSFQRTTNAEHARAFIQMCVDILPMTDDGEIYDRAAQVLNKSFQGMQAGAASMILHCLKPYTFPVLNFNRGRGNIFEILGVKLIRRGNIDTYIENCRKIKAFRDANFTVKNYRIFDIVTWKLEQYELNPDNGTSEEKAELNSHDITQTHPACGRGSEGETCQTEFDRNFILYGPPGTGKTYNSVIYAVAICEGSTLEKVKNEDYPDVLSRYNALRSAGKILFTTFHQSYGYEEFIEGIRPVMADNSDSGGLEYEIRDGIFKKLCNAARTSGRGGAAPHVLVIDEINRGNISKIFGELITLIEETKREGAAEAMEAVLPYSGETFSVPNNVYIIGTMNTADRSIALMDTALRRRFGFVEMMPDSKALEDLGIGSIRVGEGELNVSRMLDVINERIEFLFDREHTIGHAFFMKLADDPSMETLADIFDRNIIPLLQEYFYEDYEKIQLVLGDNSKPDEYKFILDRTIKVKDIFNGNPDIDLPEKGYQVQNEAFLKPESYKQIGRGL